MCERATSPLDAMLVEAGGRTHDDPLGAVCALAVSALTRLATDPARSGGLRGDTIPSSPASSRISPGARARPRCGCLSNVESILNRQSRAGNCRPTPNTALATRLLHAYISGIMREVGV
jgi:hypothetical protein